MLLLMPMLLRDPYSLEDNATLYRNEHKKQAHPNNRVRRHRFSNLCIEVSLNGQDTAPIPNPAHPHSRSPHRHTPQHRPPPPTQPAPKSPSPLTCSWSWACRCAPSSPPGAASAAAGSTTRRRVSRRWRRRGPRPRGSRRRACAACPARAAASCRRPRGRAGAPRCCR